MLDLKTQLGGQSRMPKWNLLYVVSKCVERQKWRYSTFLHSLFPYLIHLVVDKPRAGTHVANNGPNMNIFLSLVCPGVCLDTVNSYMRHGMCF